MAAVAPSSFLYGAWLYKTLVATVQIVMYLCVSIFEYLAVVQR